MVKVSVVKILVYTLMKFPCNMQLDYRSISKVSVNEVYRTNIRKLFERGFIAISFPTFLLYLIFNYCSI